MSKGILHSWLWHATSWWALRSIELLKTFFFYVFYMQVEHYIELCPKYIESCHWGSPVMKGDHHHGGCSGEGCVPTKLLWLWTPPPTPSQYAPVNNHACVVLWYLRRKDSVSIQLATNKTNTTCHSGLSQSPHSPHHMLVCSNTLFTFLLANYLPLSAVCLGAGCSVIGGIAAIL